MNLKRSFVPFVIEARGADIVEFESWSVQNRMSSSEESDEEPNHVTNRLQSSDESESESENEATNNKPADSASR